MLERQILTDHETMSQYARAWLVERIAARPTSLLCLAAGGTPARTYALLTQRGRRDPQLVDKLRVIQLDEWGGLSRENPGSCQRQLHEEFVAPLSLAERFVAIDGRAKDPHLECQRIADWLAANGPIDVCVLGLGLNGHLGFNEPGDSLQAHAHVSPLSPASLKHAMVGEMAHAPTYGMTLGMADILQARQILLLVSGARKSEPLARLLGGPIMTSFPASLLHLHPAVTLICDADAARASNLAAAVPSSPGPAR